MSTPPLGRLLGIGREAEVFEWGTKVVKLYKANIPKHSAFREATALALVEEKGFPAPQVFGIQAFGDRWGIVMTRAQGRSFADAMAQRPAEGPAYLRDMAALHSRIHGRTAQRLLSLKTRLIANIGIAASLLGDSRRRRLLEELGALGDDCFLCHGNFHPWNILGSPGHAIVVDWLNASSGTPAADVCRSYVLMRASDANMAARYVAVYAAVAGMTADQIFNWLPVTAAAPLAEGVPDETAPLMEMVDRPAAFSA